MTRAVTPGWSRSDSPPVTAPASWPPTMSRARGLLPGPARRALGRLGDLYPKLDWAPRFLRARTTLQALGKSSGEAYAEAVGVTPPALRAR